MRRPIVPSIVVFLLVVGACTADEAPSRVEAADEPLATATSPHALASEPIRILRKHQVHGFRSFGVDSDDNARDNLAVGADGLLHIVANVRTSLGIGWPVWLTLDPEAPSPVTAVIALISPAESALVANGIATSSTSDDLFIHSFDFRRFDGGRLVQRYDTSSRAMVAERWIPGSVSGQNPVRWAAAHGGARATGGHFMGFEGNLDSIDNGAYAYGAPHPYLYNAPTRQTFQVQDARVRFVGAHGGVIFDRYDGGDALWGAIEPAGTRAFSLVSQQVNPCSPILPCYRWGMAVRSYDIASHAGIANWEEPVNDQRLPEAGIVLLDPSTGGVVVVGEYRSPSDPFVRELYVTRLSRGLGVLSPTTRISVSTPYFRLRDVLIDSDGTLIIGLYQRTLADFFTLRVIGPQGQDRGTLAMAPVEAEGVRLKRGPDGKIYLLANEDDSIVVYEMVRDTDGDGLPDAWEMGPLDFDGDGITDIDLAALGADPMHKDIFLEIDPVSACESWCVPTPTRPRAHDDGRCCFEPGATCDRRSLGRATWQRIGSHGLMERSPAQCGAELNAYTRDYSVDGCHCDFKREPGGQVFVDTFCRFHRHGEGRGEEAYLCLGANSTCDRGEDYSVTDYTSSCRTRTPYNFETWPVVELSLCELDHRQDVIVIDEKVDYCRTGGRRKTRNCVPRSRLTAGLQATIDVERFRRTGNITQTPLPCPVGSDCYNHENVKWNFVADFGPR